ncbi:MAG: type IV pilus modification protein PilV [Gammaproteobacteria bacterium 28-57-27]|nr:MAG: type IV pilus modification protein PilV [Gammaproteobacteria bacterium 28-57-27]
MNPTTRPSRQNGFSILEALIAVLVLSIGLLGVAALQASALRNNQSALERSLAVMQSYSIFDAMRANVAAMRTGNYNMGLTCTPPSGGTLAQNDRRQWLIDVQAALNDSSACGSIACTPAGVCTVSVQWDDSRGGVLTSTGTTSGSTTETVTTVSQL